VDSREFLLRACHDLRNPVRAIRAHAELMVKTPAPGESRQHLDFILDGARAIELLAEGLAGYASALHVEPHSFQSVPMGVMLRNATSRLDKEIRERGASVTSTELPSVSGDAGLLLQVFEQLLRNAIRHSRRSPLQIHVAAQKEGPEWIFAIHDDGCGIEEAYLERIFKPFERLDGSKSGGVGLGLAICRVIVEGHRGRIWAESTPGTGSAFRFTLPAFSR
jgi:chemotaxis family two-component system sensor kinase Cph1